MGAVGLEHRRTSVIVAQRRRGFFLSRSIINDRLPPCTERAAEETITKHISIKVPPTTGVTKGEGRLDIL